MIALLGGGWAPKQENQNQVRLHMTEGALP